jgi:hypothetical protein
MARENSGCATKTMVANSARVIADPGSLDLASFLDLSSFCDACVLLDRIDVMESPDEIPDGGDLVQRMRDAGVLGEFHPTISGDDLIRVALRYPPALTGSLLESSELLGQPEAVRDPALLDGAGRLVEFDYGRDLDGLLEQLDEIVTYPSMEPRPDPRERVLRSTLYLISATASGRDYFPDFDRVPFTVAAIRDVYRSLPLQLYERVAESLGMAYSGGAEDVAEWTLDLHLPIPPVTSLVLSRSSTLTEIPDRLLEVREEFEPFRSHFGEFKEKLRSAETVKERRKLKRRYMQLLQAASGEDRELVTATEVLNLAEGAVSVGAAPVVPTSYSANLVTQPAEWIRRWWLRRPLAVLFRLDGKLPNVATYRGLIERLWGEGLQAEVLSEFAAHSGQVRAWFAESPPDS